MDEIRVQVCYARPDVQYLRDVTLPSGATLQAAIEQSGVLREFPEIDPAVFRVGVYGKLKTPDTVLRDHDRVEIYRHLIADPKESRRKRAVKKVEKKAR
ncbi:MAG TPA: RnfH family protein [Noviherbaspirillum sp.]|nr:RnfH family protein [Noviherbaspirillum sp.]